MFNFTEYLDEEKLYPYSYNLRWQGTSYSKEFYNSSTFSTEAQCPLEWKAAPVWQLRSVQYYPILLKLKQVSPCLSENKPLYSQVIFVHMLICFLKR